MKNKDDSSLIKWISLVLLGTAVLGFVFAKPLPHLTLSTQNLHFDGKMAFAKMAELAENFPYRIQGNKNLALSADWIENEFKRLGYLPSVQTFSERVYEVTYTDLKNVWSEKRGSTHPEEIIIVCAHYDISEKTKFGAMDDASGIGVVLELAKIFKEESPRRTILFLAVSAEELGAHWGARSFIQEFGRINQVKAVITFDFVAPHKQVGIIQLQDGEKQGFTPLWLRQMSVESIASVHSLIPDDLQHVMEYIQRATLHPASDHGVFLKAGIPALNWTGKSSEFPLEMKEVHHTLNDRTDAMQVESFRDYGQAAEKLVRSIDELKEIPGDRANSNDFKLSNRSFLPGFFVKLIQYLLFLPFFGFCLIQARKNRTLQNWKKNSDFLLELKCIALWSGALMMVYSVVRAFPTLNLVPFFEMQPGAAKSDVSHSLSFTIIATIMGLIISFYYLFKRSIAQPKAESNRLPNQVLAQLTVFSFLCLLGICLNSFTATLFLCIPAYAWMTTYRWISFAKRRTLLTLSLIGTLPFILVFSIMGFMYQNFYIFYYLILCAVYGVFEPSTVFVGLGSWVVFYRMFYLLIKTSSAHSRYKFGYPTYSR